MVAFNILRSSSIGGRLPSEFVFHRRSSSIGGRLLFEVVLISNTIEFHCRSSSICFPFFFKENLLSVWSPKLKSIFLGRSNQWLLRYSTFDILRSSYYNRGRLHFKHFLLSVYSPKLKFKI